MATPSHQTVSSSAPAELEAILQALIDAGKGWVNLRPDVADKDRPPAPSGLGKLFSGRGPAVPVATFVAGGTGKAHLVGVEHGSGPKARRRLGEAGVRAPAGSEVKSDHARRGLVLAVPATTAAGEIARFLFAAAAGLSIVPLRGTWDAEVYEG